MLSKALPISRGQKPWLPLTRAVDAGIAILVHPRYTSPLRLQQFPRLSCTVRHPPLVIQPLYRLDILDRLRERSRNLICDIINMRHNKRAIDAFQSELGGACCVTDKVFNQWFSHGVSLWGSTGQAISHVSMHETAALKSGSGSPAVKLSSLSLPRRDNTGLLRVPAMWSKNPWSTI